MGAEEAAAAEASEEEEAFLVGVAVHDYYAAEVAVAGWERGRYEG